MSTTLIHLLGHSHGLWNEGEKPHQQRPLLLQERSHQSNQDSQKTGTFCFEQNFFNPDKVPLILMLTSMAGVQTSAGAVCRTADQGLL